MFIRHKTHFSKTHKTSLNNKWMINEEVRQQQNRLAQNKKKTGAKANHTSASLRSASFDRGRNEQTIPCGSFQNSIYPTQRIRVHSTCSGLCPNRPLTIAFPTLWLLPPSDPLCKNAALCGYISRFFFFFFPRPRGISSAVRRDFVDRQLGVFCIRFARLTLLL